MFRLAFLISEYHLTHILACAAVTTGGDLRFDVLLDLRRKINSAMGHKHRPGSVFLKLSEKTLCEVAIKIRLIVPQISRAVGATFATKLIFSEVCLANLSEFGCSYARVPQSPHILKNTTRQHLAGLHVWETFSDRRQVYGSCCL
jgi:hypothetical protein